MLGGHISAHAEAQFLRSLAAGELAVEPLTAADYARTADLVVAYRSLPLGAVDAMVIAIAERLGAGTIATIDRRDFSVVRPRHVDHFELILELTPTR